ncbi:MAG: 4-alpha-glucanotransferase [Gammaproteobacteria bacterium]
MSMQPVSPTSGRRRFGITAHITSLPGPGAHGGLGPEAYRFVDFLAAASCRVWQVLPLNAVNASGSPYQGSSVFAGNPAWLPRASAATPADAEYAEFRCAQAHWLEDYALYCALRAEQGGQPWYLWPPALRDREPSALAQARVRCRRAMEKTCKAQCAFFSAWRQLRQYAHRAGVYVFGDLPMFVAHDSADVWSRREFFAVDGSGQLTQVAGAPPDDFAAHGQNWGCPEYRWEPLAKDGFRWWRARLAMQASLFDILRLDHFRGFEASWCIPVQAQSAAEGAWMEVPGRALFTALQPELVSLQLVAENLGHITPEVEQLRAELSLPGMRVLQFAFSDASDNPHLPQNHAPRDVVYTGTHDTDTTLGWWRALDATTRERVFNELRHPTEPMPWPLVQAAMASVCWLAMLPLQDCLALGSEARMNTPGRVEGNWAWRCAPHVLNAELQSRLRELARRYGRSD